MGNVNSDLLNKHMNVIKSLQDLEKLKSLKVAQKAKIKWSIEGDKNSKYFHGILNKKRNNLAIRDIQVDLEKNVTKDELKRVVWDCGLDKSPRTDGFTFGFYRRYWSLLENDVMEGVSYFFQHAKKKQTTIFKVDFEKAIDSVRWDYLDDVLKNFVLECSRVFLLARLSKWKMKTLSIGGRLTLLKSVLGSTPIYYMSLFKVPLQVLRRMESIRSRFFNGVDVNENKMSWVNWNKVLVSKDKGDLGVSSFYAMNHALMFKWVWRFKYDNTSSWARFITTMHGKDGLLGKSVKFPFPFIWLDIIRDSANLNNQGIDLLRLFKKKIGNGFDTSF
ncbi:hypothetical protein Tco_1289553 [Tanacetum coccineum]